MDILLASPDAPADEHIGSLILFLNHLHDDGHSVSAIQTSDSPTDSFPVKTVSVTPPTSPWWVNLWRYYRTWRQRIDDHLQTHSPDVVVTNRRTHVPTAQAARPHGVPVVAIIEGLGFLRYNPRKLTADKRPVFRDLPIESKLQYPFIWSLFRQQREAFPEFAAIVSLSSFLQHTIEATFGVDSEVIETTIDLSVSRACDRTPKYITMINPRTQLKGTDVFIDIVKQMPDHEFLVAGEFPSLEYQQYAESLDNIQYLGWVDDISQVYEETKLILVPSLVEEGGPRVICEAFTNEIPVVGTNRGGVPEFIGDAGAVVDDPTDIDQWCLKIETVLEQYDRMTRLAADRATMFDVERNVKHFEDVLRRAVDSS